MRGLGFTFYQEVQRGFPSGVFGQPECSVIIGYGGGDA